MAIPNVEITSTIIVKPSSPLPYNDRPSNYLHTLVPLTVFDLANYDCHIPCIYAFRHQMPTNQTLIHALGEALFHYPHLAGTFTSDHLGHPCILLDDHGVRVIATKVPTPLQQHLPLDPSNNLMNLVPPVADATELFQVQLNRFGCGGLVIGHTSHHRVADGISIASFYTTWAKMVAASGNFSPFPLPYHDRAAVSIPRNPPACEFPHGEIEFKKRNQLADTSNLDVVASLAKMRITTAHFSKAFLLKLKEKAIGCGENGKSRCSTFACVLAHVWKTVTLARGPVGDRITRVRTAVNGRTRVRPPVPMQYFGNYVLWAFPEMKVSELLSATHGEVVSVIRKAVEEVDDGYVKSCIDFGELMRRGEVGGRGGGEMVGSIPAVGESLSPDLAFNCWLGLRFDDVDFGMGRPCAFVPPSLPVEGLAILLPSCEEEGGADVYVSLTQEHAAVFEELCYSLE